MRAGAPWFDEFPAAITVCDREGVILAMNLRSCETFARQGGRALIGRSLLDCHPEPARSRLTALLETGGTNVYTIEKEGRKKMIYQAPWSDGGEVRGLVEISFEIPQTLPHFVRT